MTQLTLENYRHNWDLYKGLLAQHILLFKLLLIWVQICLSLT